MAKRALQTLVRGQDGRQKLVYIDVDTGEVVPYSEIKNYQIITGDAQNYWNQQVTPAKPTETKAPEEKEDSALKRAQDNQRHGSDPGFFDEDQNNNFNSSLNNRNFGWVDKPDWMDTVAGILPGKAGLAAKAVNSAINATSIPPTNKARNFMGLDDLSFKDSIKSTLKNRQGQVADVKIGDNKYSVGFEALSPGGRTNLTPQEAKLRSVQNNAPIEEIAPRGAIEGSKASKEKGFLTGLVGKTLGKAVGGPAGSVIEGVTGLKEGWAGNILSSIFGGKNESKPMTPSEPVLRETVSTTPTSTVGSSLGFMSMAGAAGKEALPSLSKTRGPMNEVDGLVFHHTGPGLNTPADVVKTLNDRGFGAQYIMDRQGNIFQTTPDSVAHIKNAQNNSGLTNDNTIGIEVMAADNNDLTPEQIRAGLDFIKSMQEQFPDIKNNIFGHGELNPHKMADEGMGIVGAFRAANNIPEWDSFTRTFGAPTPTPAPRNTLDPVTEQDLNPISSTSRMQSIDQAQNYAQQVVQEVRKAREAREFKNASPAEFAANGLIERTPDQVSRIAQALAGELSPSQLKALEANDPVAKRELANMVATIENRAMSKTFGSLDGALRSDQYNSLMKGNLGVTTQNYDLYKDVLNKNVSDFYTGAVKPDDYSFTNYHAGGVNPAWSEVMGDKTRTGDHIFGVLGPAQGDPTYDYTQDFIEGRDFYSTYGDRKGIGTFGSTDSPGVGRSLLDAPSMHSFEHERDTSLNGFMGRTVDNSSAYSDRVGRGTFGTSSSPGVGRGSFSSESGGGGALGGRSSGPSPSSPAGGSQAAGGFSGGSRSSGSTSNHSTERERDTSLGGRSPTNDGYAGSKTPGGGF